MYFGYDFKAYMLPCGSPPCCNISTHACNCAGVFPYWFNPCGWYV